MKITIERGFVDKEKFFAYIEYNKLRYKTVVGGSGKTKKEAYDDLLKHLHGVLMDEHQDNLDFFAQVFKEVRCRE